ncbi:Na+/H+ antiporter subunit E [Rhodocyclaceae bacterium SMB388]
MNALPGPYSTAFAIRGLGLAALWWVLAGGEAWAAGGVLALLIAGISLLHTPPSEYRLAIRRIPGFTVFFLTQSLRAGVDVAQRTLDRSLPLEPAMLRVPLRLPAGAPTWWLMLVISLLPGTLSVRLAGRTLELHCLDERLDVLADLRRAETAIGRLFDCEPAADGAGPR